MTTFMKFFKRTSLALAILAIGWQAAAQSSLKYIPSNVPVVLTLNLKNLEKKVNLDQLKQYTFYQDMVKSIQEEGGMTEDESGYFEEFMFAPENLGYDVLEPVYFFVKKEGNLAHFTLVTKLADRPKYEQGLQKLTQARYRENVSQREGYLLLQDGGDTYAWNDEVVVNVWTERTPEPYSDWSMEEEPFDDGEEMDPGEMEWEELPAEDEEPVLEEIIETDRMGPEREAAAEWAGKVLRREFLQAMGANEKFKTATQQASDFHVWMDYGFFVEMMNEQRLSGMGLAGKYHQVMTMMQAFSEVFYADTYLSMSLNFEAGKMSLRSELFFNEELRGLYQGMFDVKFNKKFLRYVKGGNQLFGYFYLNYNIEKTIEEGKGLMYKLFEATPEYGEAAADAMKILGIIIDEEAIGKLLRGDLLVSVSGLQTVPVKTTIYDFDEDFNYIPKDTTVLKTLPVFTAMLSYGNGKDIQKFIDLGLHSNVLVQEGGHYKFVIPEAEGLDVYLAKRKGVLLFTNDRSLVEGQPGKGYDRKQRLSKKHRKMLCENATAMYWDIPNTIKAVSGDKPAAAGDPMAYLNMLGKEFDSVEIYSSKKVGDSTKGQFDFNFRNKRMNSLQQFFNFVNDVYLEVIGGAKI